MHVPEATIYHLYFKGLADERILYSREDERASQPDYTLVDAHAGDLSDQTQFRARPAAGRPGAVELTIPSLRLEAGEVLAASPLSRTDRGMQRMTTVTGDGARRLVLVDLSAGESGEARRLTVIFDGRLDRIAKLQIYAIGERSRRLIADLDVGDN